MTWFEKLVGFSETSPQRVRNSIEISGSILRSRENGQEFTCGMLEILSLGELRMRFADVPRDKCEIQFSEIVGDVKALHRDPGNEGAMFQVASQFNLLEMVSPSVTPERGVGIYENDRTQGPACAIAAGAGTIYRNYFVPVNGQLGQSADSQIDCLQLIGEALGNTEVRLWKMQNGYALPTSTGLNESHERLTGMNEAERDSIREKLQIGVQWGTQVTLGGCRHTVSQAYCSALPVAYCHHPTRLWAPFATLVLEAAYEATLCAAALNRLRTGNRQVFLTLLGGGAFRNDPAWIIEAIGRAFSLHRQSDLDVQIVSYGSPKDLARRITER